MFEITIKGETPKALLFNLEAAFKTFMLGEEGATTKPVGKSKAKAPDPQPEPEVDDELTGEDALDAPAEPMPEGADAIVDAGTGQPVAKKAAKAKTEDDAPIQMTFDDVKVAAAKLAAKDTPALAKILAKYDAPNLSGVDKAQLGDFAADVMEALG